MTAYGRRTPGSILLGIGGAVGILLSAQLARAADIIEGATFSLAYPDGWKELFVIAENMSGAGIARQGEQRATCTVTAAQKSGAGSKAELDQALSTPQGIGFAAELLVRDDVQIEAYRREINGAIAVEAVSEGDGKRRLRALVVVPGKTTHIVSCQCGIEDFESLRPEFSEIIGSIRIKS